MRVSSVGCYQKTNYTKLGVLKNYQKLSHNVPKTEESGITFGTYNRAAAEKFEKELARRGIKCDTRGNDFVAECYRNTVDLFEKLFGKSYLPEKLSYKPLRTETYGTYSSSFNEVTLNEEHDFDMFFNMDSLKKTSEKAYRFLTSNKFSTLHPAHIFVHEFSHAAHWHHLENRNGYNNADKVWRGLVGVTVPTAIGRLITRFKLGDYAVDGRDMCEFLAERMTKDICAGITDNIWTPYKDIDVDYSHIFSKKWDYRYTTPQSYIDYFTQQVWDGDIEEANRAGDMAGLYLAKLEASKVHPIINTIAQTIDYTPSINTEKKETLVSKFGSWLSGILLNFNENITDKLDKKNRLKLNE